MDVGIAFLPQDESPGVDELMAMLENGEIPEEDGVFIRQMAEPAKLVAALEGKGADDKSIKYLLMNLATMTMDHVERRKVEVHGIEVLVPTYINGADLKFGLNSLRNFVYASDWDKLGELFESQVLPFLMPATQPRFYSGMREEDMELFYKETIVEDISTKDGRYPGERRCGVKHIFTTDKEKRNPVRKAIEHEKSIWGLYGEEMVDCRVEVFVEDHEESAKIQVHGSETNGKRFLFEKKSKVSVERKPSGFISRGAENVHRRLRFVTDGYTHYFSPFVSWLLLQGAKQKTQIGSRLADKVQELEKFKKMASTLSSKEARKMFGNLAEGEDLPFRTEKMALLTRRVADLLHKQDTLKDYRCEIIRTDPYGNHLAHYAAKERDRTCCECKRKFRHLACMKCGVGDFRGKCLVCCGAISEEDANSYGY